MFLAPPSTFLDPYDCRYKINRDFIKSENNRREFYSKHYGLNNLNHPFIYELIELNPVTDELIDEVELKRRKINDSLFGVFSASTTYRNNHLWSVFGKNRKGFCVGLDFKKVFPLEEGMKGKVEYVEEENLPVSKVLNYDDLNEFTKYAFELILTLPIEFIDEQEYRI